MPSDAEVSWKGEEAQLAATGAQLAEHRLTLYPVAPAEFVQETLIILHAFVGAGVAEGEVGGGGVVLKFIVKITVPLVESVWVADGVTFAKTAPAGPPEL